GAELSKETRAAILAAAGAEKSKAEIAREIGCNRSIVYDTIKRWNQHHNSASQPRKGHPELLSRRDKHAVFCCLRSRP
ncbi:hypothetical protein EV356DRAFT_456796, partial [Viridothelium virens]